MSVLDVNALSGLRGKHAALEIVESGLSRLPEGRCDVCFIITEEDSPFVQWRNSCAALIVWVVPTDKQIGSQSPYDTRFFESAIMCNVNEVNIETVRVIERFADV